MKSNHIKIETKHAMLRTERPDVVLRNEEKKSKDGVRYTLNIVSPVCLEYETDDAFLASTYNPA